MNEGSAIKEYDAYGGDKLCTRTYYLSVRDTSNLDKGLGGFIHVTLVLGIC
jgi:hypothetical protein